MKHYSSNSHSKFSLSNVNCVYNDEGIPVHKEDFKNIPRGTFVQKDNKQTESDVDKALNSEQESKS